MSYSITIQSDDIPKQINNLLKIEVEQEREYRLILRGLLKSGKQEVVSEIPVYTGRARGSVKTRISGFGARLRGTLGAGAGTGWWINILEYGRRSKKLPPSDALLGWVQNVLGIPEGQAKVVAYAVARSIARKGQPALKMFERTRLELFSRATPLFAAANERIVNKMVVR